MSLFTTAKPYSVMRLPAVCVLDWRRKVFNSLHSISHPGIRATQRLVPQRYVWPSVNKDVRRWTKMCLLPKLKKIQRHNKSLICAFLPPSAPFESVHTDIIGPLPPSEDFCYVLTIVDRFTLWPQAVPIRDITAGTVAKAFVFGWVSRFEVSGVVTTDRDRPFESDLWHQLMKFFGPSCIRTTAYRTASNGMTERFHHQMKAAIMA